MEIKQFRWEHIGKQRYYKVILSRDLLGDWIVTKAWGHLHNASGRIVHLPFSSYKDALENIQKISKTRKQRGYHLLTLV